MKRFVEENKGITLIALIITIIVMLILVAVTINVSLNGGLFNKAKTAAAQTEQESLYEELIASTEYTNSGEINVLATYNAFKEGKEVTLITTGLDSNAKNVVFTVAGKTGIYTYSITTGKIIKGEIPWVEKGVTTCFADYDKKYTYDLGYGKLVIEIRSDGTIYQITEVDSSTGLPLDESIMTINDLLEYGSVFYSTYVEVGPNKYEFYDNKTMKITWSNVGTPLDFTLE